MESEYCKMRNKIKNNIKSLVEFQVDQFSPDFEEGILRVAVGGVLAQLLEENDDWFSSRNYHSTGEDCE